jgi:tyrosine-protein kinase
MSQARRDPQLVDLRELFGILRRRKWTVLLTTAIVVLSALSLVYLRPTVYTSHAVVEVQPSDSAEQPDDINMDTEAARVTLGQVAALAAPAMGLDADSSRQLEQAVEGVSVAVPPNTTYLNISCTAATSAQSRNCASAFANAYVDDRVNSAQEKYDRVQAEIMRKIRLANSQLDRLEGLTPDSAEGRRSLRRAIERQNQIILSAQALAVDLPSPSPTAAVVSGSADLPDVPANKSFAVTGGLAALLGLVLGIALALIRERLDETIRDGAGLEEALAAPLLATVPHVSGSRHTLITRDAPQSQSAEAYRTARSTLLYLAKKQWVRVVAVTSPGEREGKSATTANLGACLATGGERVVVVSCDLRKPQLHLFLQRLDEKGLSDVLNRKLPWRDVLQETDIDGLSIIASGPVPDNPAELLGTDDMRILLADLGKEFDLVLLDTAPALLVADAATLIPNTDGVLVVARASKTSRTAVRRLRDQFERVGGYVIGGILTNRPRERADNLSYFHSHDAAASRDTTRGEPIKGPNTGNRRAEGVEGTARLRRS